MEFVFKIMQELMNQDLSNLLLSSDYIRAIFNYGQYIVFLLSGIAFLFETYKAVIEGSGNFLPILFRITLVIILLSVYPVMLFNTLDFFNSLGSQFITEDGLINLNEIVSNSTEEKEFENESGFLGFLGGSIITSLSEGLSLLLTMISHGTIIAIMIVRNLSIIFFIIIAPLIFPLFILEQTKNYFTGWVLSFSNVLLWPLWIGLLLYAFELIAPALGEVSKSAESKDGIYISLLQVGYNFALLFFLMRITNFLNSLKGGSAGATSRLANLVGGLGMMAVMKGGSKMAKGTAFAGAVGLKNTPAGVITGANKMRSSETNLSMSDGVGTGLGIQTGRMLGKHNYGKRNFNNSMKGGDIGNSDSLDSKNSINGNNNGKTCSKCGGTGYIKQFKNHYDGICFKCGGTGFTNS
ncbi:MAG: hypothetical protein ACOCV1_04775 [Bacillota bacterium]